MTPIKILLVEDYVPFRRAIYLLLRESAKFQVFEASDGAEALRKAEELQPDLIFFDISLPKLNGFESAKRARTLVPNARLLFLSQESSEDVALETFLLGAQAYVRKEHVLTELFPAIEAVLRGELYLSGLEFSQGADAKQRNEKLMHHADTAYPQKAENVQLGQEVVLESLDDAIISKNLDGIITFWNRAAHRIFGYTEEEMIGRSITIIIPPELHDEENDILRRVGAGQRIDHHETRLVSKEGKTIDVSLTICPVGDAEGRIIGTFTIARDITDRKQMEEAQRSLNRKLIHAQDEERHRIARELHDDINQRLACLVLGLGNLEKRPPTSPDAFVREIIEVRKRLTELGNDIQAVSHRLHPANLKILELKKATIAVCKELSVRQGIMIDFHVDDVPETLPQDVSLCLFRVLQEALQNAIRHSDSRHIQVRLQSRANDIELVVRDFGRGFEPEETNGPGLGLTSMRERLKLVNGQLSIDSKRQGGTTIHALVPLKPSAESASAGG
jgi:PAS domain S-box-containing protein